MLNLLHSRQSFKIYFATGTHIPILLLLRGYNKQSCFQCSFHRAELLYVELRFEWAGGVGTGRDDGFPENLRRHLSQNHRPDKTPKKCAKRVKDLTKLLVRMEAYPAAYGGFSDIWCCRLQDENSHSQKVAVKAIRPVILNTEDERIKREAIEQELEVWFQLEHSNVLPLYGITSEFGPFPAFVSPWAEHGTLSEYLEKFETRLDLKKRLKLGLDVAAGLKYLHSRSIVHGDLSGSNVLVTKGGRAVVADFGLSTRFDTESSCSFPGNIRWAAPELFDACVEGGSTPQQASRQADIYSFGSVMFQILTGKLPFHGVQRVAQIVIMVSRGDRPSRQPSWDGKDIPNTLWHFLQQCWEKIPSERPSCKDIAAFIDRQLSRFYKGKRRRAPRRRVRGACFNY